VIPNLFGGGQLSRRVSVIVPANRSDRRVRITLHEIAKRANVSIATVSRTINCAPNVDPSLARRVRKVIEEVGYYPNTHARALVSGRSRIFGLMVSDTIGPFLPEIVQTFEKLGFAHNYEIFLSSIARDPRQMELAVRRMIERRVEGVAILSFDEEISLIEAFKNRTLPIVVLDKESREPLLKTVCIDYLHGVRQAVQHLAALGHVRIALIAGPARLRTAVARKIAFQECMKEIGLEIPPQLLVEGDHTLEAGMKALCVLAALPDRPSAVLCSNDMTAIGVIRGAFELGLDVARDLSVVGFDDNQIAQFATPPLTTVQMSHVEVANVAFRVLLDAVGGQCNGSSRKVCAIQSNLVLRCSTNLAPGRLGDSAASKRADKRIAAGRTQQRVGKAVAKWL
jgi:DNA-binding LacI/PurR family transcriptional regulator